MEKIQYPTKSPSKIQKYLVVAAKAILRIQNVSQFIASETNAGSWMDHSQPQMLFISIKVAVIMQ